MTEQWVLHSLPGTELKHLLSKFGIIPHKDCDCESHVAEMNRMGPQWCRDNIDIIVGWLRDEASRSGYPFTEAGAKILIKFAIRQSLRRKMQVYGDCHFGFHNIH